MKQGLVILLGNCKNPGTGSLCIMIPELYTLWNDFNYWPFSKLKEISKCNYKLKWEGIKSLKNKSLS